MAGAKYIESFGGWLAFKHGKTLQNRRRRIKVFATKETALKAARQSKMRPGVR